MSNGNLKKAFDITPSARELDRLKNKDVLREAERNKNSIILGFIEDVLLEIEKLSTKEKAVITTQELLLGLAEADGDELLVQGTHIAFKKSLLEKLRRKGVLTVLISDLYKTVDEGGSLPIEVRVAKVSFVPSKLKLELLVYRKQLTEEKSEQNEEELRLIGNGVSYRGERVATLGGKYKMLFKVLHANAETYRSGKVVREGKYISLKVICEQTEYAIRGIRSSISKLEKKLNESLKSSGIKVDISANGNGGQRMSIEYRK